MNRRFSDPEFHLLWERLSVYLLLGALIFGAYLRIEMYLFNHSFIHAPSALANNVIEKDYLELFGRLGARQSAPIAFLIVSKFFGSFFQYSEFSLTFLPLLFGLGTLVSFLYLCIRVLGKSAAIAAYLPFVVCSSAIYHAGEFKQYSGDLFFCILVLITAWNIYAGGFSKRSVFWYTCVGIVSVLFSLQAVILLAGTGTVLFLLALIRRNRTGMIYMAVSGFLIVGHFAAWYFLQIRPNVWDEVFSYWNKGYLPLPFTHGSVLWLQDTFHNYLLFPLGFHEYSIPIPAYILAFGLIASLLVKKFRPLAFMIVAIVLILITLSALKQYPLSSGAGEIRSRLMLFTAPVAFLLLGMGVLRLAAITPIPSIIVAALTLVLVYPQINRIIDDPIEPRFENRKLYDTLAELYQEGDLIYVTFRSEETFRYHNRINQLPWVTGTTMAGTTDWFDDLDPYMAQPEIQRIWVVITHGFGKKRFRFFRIMAEGMGRVEDHNFKGAWLLLGKKK